MDYSGDLKNRIGGIHIRIQTGNEQIFYLWFFRDSQTNIRRCMCEYIDMENIGILGDSFSLDIKWKKIY